MTGRSAKWAYAKLMDDGRYAFVHAYCAPTQSLAKKYGGRGATVASAATCAAAKKKASAAGRKKHAKKLGSRRR